MEQQQSNTCHLPHNLKDHVVNMIDIFLVAKSLFNILQDVFFFNSETLISHVLLFPLRNEQLLSSNFVKSKLLSKFANKRTSYSSIFCILKYLKKIFILPEHHVNLVLTICADIMLCNQKQFQKSNLKGWGFFSLLNLIFYSSSKVCPGEIRLCGWGRTPICCEGILLFMVMLLAAKRKILIISFVKQNWATISSQPTDLSHLKECAQQQNTTGCAFEPKQCVSKYAIAYCNSKQLSECTIVHIVNCFPQPAPKRQSLVHQGKKPTHLLQLFLNLPPIRHIFIRQEDTQKILNFFPKGGKILFPW